VFSAGMNEFQPPKNLKSTVTVLNAVDHDIYNFVIYFSLSSIKWNGSYGSRPGGTTTVAGYNTNLQ